MPRAAVISVKDDRQLPLGSDAEGAGAIRRFPTTSEGRGCERERHFRQSDGKTFAANNRLAAPRRRQTTGKKSARRREDVGRECSPRRPPSARARTVTTTRSKRFRIYIHKMYKMHYIHMHKPVRRDKDRHHDEVEEVPFLHI